MLESRIFFSASVLIILSGCISLKTIPVTAYNTETGEKLEGKFFWSGAKGAASFAREDGSVCEGEYLTEIGGSSSAGRAYSWGNIYSWGANSVYGGPTTVSSTSRPNTQVGSAILVCQDKDVIECEYVVNADNHGSGYCRDKNDGRYKLFW